jgi:shikimate dehydrogenase
VVRKNAIDAVVVPMGVKAEEYRELFPLLFRMSNIRGALVTMPHKVVTCELVDALSLTAMIAGAATPCWCGRTARPSATAPVS